MPSYQAIPLPKRWPEHVKSALIRTVSLTTTAFIASYGRISQKKDRMARSLAELDLAKREIALLKEEIRCTSKIRGRNKSMKGVTFYPLPSIEE